MMTNKCNPVLLTDIEDLQIRSVLDLGFVNEFEIAPEIHAHTYFELLIVMEGELTLELSDGEVLHFGKESLCLIPPMVYHSTRMRSESAKKLALRFYCERRSERQSQPSVFEAWHAILFAYRTVTVLHDGAVLCDILQKLRDEMTAQHLASWAYMQAMLVQFYIQLFRMLGEPKDAETFRFEHKLNEQELRRLRIEEYIFENCHEPIIEDDLARQMSLSRRQLSRILQQLYGMSFRQILIDTRLHRAAQLLLTTDFTIEKIAELVGYTSLSGFYTAFHQKFKISAGQYRRGFENQR